MDTQQRILVSGASGFIGTVLCNTLRQQGCAVLPVPRTIDAAFVAQAQAFAPTVMIENAWAGSLPAQREQAQYVLPNLQFIESVNGLLAALPLQKRIFIGSQAEYNLASVYGQTKRLMALMLQQWCTASDVAFMHAQLFQVYGVQSHESYLVPSIMRALRQGNMPQLRQPHMAYDWIEVAQAAAHIAAMATTPCAPTGVYHLGTGKAYSVATMAYNLAQSLQSPHAPALQQLAQQPWTNQPLLANCAALDALYAHKKGPHL